MLYMASSKSMDELRGHSSCRCWVPWPPPPVTWCADPRERRRNHGISGVGCCADRGPGIISMVKWADSKIWKTIDDFHVNLSIDNLR